MLPEFIYLFIYLFIQVMAFVFPCNHVLLNRDKVDSRKRKYEYVILFYVDPEIPFYYTEKIEIYWEIYC